jgi:CRP-like cAMP-binding protein
MAHREDELKSAGRIATRWERGAVIYDAGSPADAVFYLESGLVKITRNISDDSQPLVHFVRPGELFGECAIMGDGPRGCTAEVVAPAVTFRYSRKLFRTMCERNPALWRWVAQTLARRMEDIERRMHSFLYRSVRERLVLSLIELANCFASTGNADPAGRVSIPLSQGDLAELIGSTRETISTTLNDLKTQGLVELGRGRMVVLSEKALRREAKRG